MTYREDNLMTSAPAIDGEIAQAVNALARNQFRTFKFSIEALKAEKGSHVDISKLSRLVANDGLAILYCDRATTITIGAGLCGLWCPLRGDVWISEGGTRLTVAKKFVYVSDSNRSYEAEVSTAGACIAVIGSQTTWSAINAFDVGEQADAPAIFPALHAPSVSVRKGIIAFARESFRGARRQCCVRQISKISAVLSQLQQSFEGFVQRCPGRTIARRRSVFLRLQRARLYIQLYNARELDVSTLAHVANYSMWQFIKIFRQVFGDTPYAHLSQRRIEVAKMLLTQKTAMGVSDVARAAGFSSRATFTRSMKQLSGATATELRMAIPAVQG